jgi:hypothetical protein
MSGCGGLENSVRPLGASFMDLKPNQTVGVDEIPSTKEKRVQMILKD